jgi:hypothetical protein
MRYNKVAVLAASVLLSTSVMAQMNADRELLKPVHKATKYVAQKSDFGSYKVERNLAYIPMSVASPDMIVSTNGSMAIVNANSPIERVGKGTLVRNNLTNEVSPLSGNISVLLKSGASADEISSKTGLSVVSAYAGTNIAVFKVNGTQDLIEASKQLKATGLVKVARIEVLEIMHKAN